jgi:hypothetical protein
MSRNRDAHRPPCRQAYADESDEHGGAKAGAEPSVKCLTKYTEDQQGEGDEVAGSKLHAVLSNNGRRRSGDE